MPCRSDLYFDLGYAPRFGLCPKLGHRPNHGHSPNPWEILTARRSLASHPAAKPELMGQTFIGLAFEAVPHIRAAKPKRQSLDDFRAKPTRKFFIDNTNPYV